MKLLAGAIESARVNRDALQTTPQAARSQQYCIDFVNCDLTQTRRHRVFLTVARSRGAGFAKLTRQLVPKNASSSGKPNCKESNGPK